MAALFEGGQLEIVRVPQHPFEGKTILARMHSLDGKLYELFVSNCEYVVNWALTRQSVSPQLRFFGAVVGLGLAALILASGGRAAA